MQSLTKESNEKINRLVSLSIKKGNTDQTFIDFIKHHAIEIEELFKAKNSHYAIETGDLIILCLEFLKYNNKDPNEILEKCYKRFENKLK
jgi:NTP pyrophosphatase (non-canonical NTP hydrolase)